MEAIDLGKGWAGVTCQGSGTVRRVRHRSQLVVAGSAGMLTCRRRVPNNALL